MSALLIQNGAVVDGTGRLPYPADVLIHGGEITAVAPCMEVPAGARVIDAAGKLVTPGFINMHAHSDCSAAMYPDMESTLGQGITTEFAGHCGLGVAPVERYWLYMFPEKRAFTRVIPEPLGGINPYDAYYVPTSALRAPFETAYGQRLDWSSYGEFLDHLRQVGTGANLALVAGHAQIRLQAMGPDYRREATKEELRTMEAALNDAMDNGALGLSLGLDYEPGLFAGHGELVCLMKLVASRGGMVTAHTRSREHSYYGHSQCFLDGLKEFLSLGRESGARIHVSHIQNGYTVSPEHDGLIRAAVEQTLAELDRARQEGVNVTWDVIPKYAFGPFHYPMAASLFQPYVAACGGCKAFSEKLSIGSYRAGIAGEIRAGNHASKGLFTRFNPKSDPDWDTRQRFTRCTKANLAGKTIREAADGKDSLDFLLDVLAADPYAAVISLGRRPEHTPDRDAFVARPEATIGLDTWTLNYDAALSEGDLPLECGSPATYAGMTVFLDTERAKGVPIQTTIQKLTGNAAKALGLRRRGTVEPGKAADLLVIDWENFLPLEDLADPRHGPCGLDYVLVGGQVAVDHGVHTHVRSGSILGPESRIEREPPVEGGIAPREERNCHDL
ncbi:MAG: amidohydrolase family protein [Oscillospiraceae bacterium]|nr:amidohydrolase family protein [Oscillospiraceae bacterium]